MREGLGSFAVRHIGITAEQEKELLSLVGYDDLDRFIEECLPQKIKSKEKLSLSSFPQALSEKDALQRLKILASQNKTTRSLLGMGYYASDIPSVIKRNILENPGWYTQYTPYQPEISQGRLEALLNFQTMVSDLSGMDIANASLLDEATAAA